MPDNSDIVFTKAARRAQEQHGSVQHYAKKTAAGFSDRITPDLAGFIGQLDTAFLGTVSAEGAPYIQHRGGPKGFIKVLDERTLRFADFAGNRQYITLSNLESNDRAFLFLLDRQPPAHQGLGRRSRGGGRRRADAAAGRLRLLGANRGRHPVHRRGLGRELLAAHHGALHHRRGGRRAVEGLRQRIAALETENARLRTAQGHPAAAPFV